MSKAQPLDDLHNFIGYYMDNNDVELRFSRRSKPRRMALIPSMDYAFTLDGHAISEGGLVRLICGRFYTMGYSFGTTHVLNGLSNFVWQAYLKIADQPSAADLGVIVIKTKDRGHYQ